MILTVRRNGMQIQTEQRKRLPEWLRRPQRAGERFREVNAAVAGRRLRTVCTSAACPNRIECWGAGTATILILGNVCSRACRFCTVRKGTPEGIDRGEPVRVAEAVAALGLDYSVVTSVTRDDLPDGGASVFAETVREIRERSPSCRVEVLIPDFLGDERALGAVLNAGPDVVNHNVETVPSLYARVRPQADYRRSVELLGRAKAAGAVTKSGLMLGLGEREEEVISVMNDLVGAGCDILTLGQYLQPRRDLLPVARYYRPEEFESLRDRALQLGFHHVEAGPLVRSSYHAGRYGALEERAR